MHLIFTIALVFFLSIVASANHEASRNHRRLYARSDVHSRGLYTSPYAQASYEGTRRRQRRRRSTATSHLEARSFPAAYSRLDTAHAAIEARTNHGSTHERRALITRDLEVSKKSAETAELALLFFIPELKGMKFKGGNVVSTKSDVGTRNWKSVMAEISGGRTLNEFSVANRGEEGKTETKNVLVMLHGFGVGLGFYYKNYEPLSRSAGWKIYSLDLMGKGRSGRPVFPTDHTMNTDKAEAWFVDALEAWRSSKNIERFTLLGHSFGGYMATAYALKYPGHVNKLILASPAGMLGQSATTKTQPKFGEVAKPGFLNTLIWNANISPFKVVGMLPSTIGMKIADKKTSGRFGPKPEIQAKYPLPLPTNQPPELDAKSDSKLNAKLDETETKALTQYTYSLVKLAPSGEYALPYVLNSRTTAINPLLKKLPTVGHQKYRKGGKEMTEPGIPIVIMYGDGDWMRPPHDVLDLAKKNIETENEKGGETQGSVQVIYILNSGHHLYIDGMAQFNKVMVEEMTKTAKTSETWDGRGHKPGGEGMDKAGNGGGSTDKQPPKSPGN